MFVDLYTRIGPERELIQHVEAVHPQHRQDMINILARRRGSIRAVLDRAP